MFKTIRFRIALVGMLPLLLALYFMLGNVVTKYSVYQQMDDLATLTELASHISAYVHEAQKERGTTAVFMGSGGTKFVSELSQQRKETDARRTALKELIAKLDPAEFGPSFQQTLEAAVAKMNEIDGNREQVSSQSVSAKQAISFYTQHNAAMLEVVEAISEASDDAELAKTTAAYANFLKGKERAGVERAVLCKTFAMDRFESGTLRKFGTLVTAQDTYFDAFRTQATPEQVAFFEQKLTGPVIDEVQQMRDIAFKKGEVRTDGFGVDARHWLEIITAKINLMKEVDDRLSEDMRATAAQERGSMESLLKLSTDISALVHETQKERGLTAGHLGSDRKQFTNELKEQRKLTDGKEEQLLRSVRSLARAGLDTDFLGDLDRAIATLEGIASHRVKVGNESISTAEAIGYYTLHNTQMLDLISATANATTDVQVRSSIIAYVYLLQGKERAGLERAVLSKAFAADEFEPGSLRQFGSLVDKQDTYFAAFRALAAPDHVAFFDQRMSEPIVAEVRRMRDIAYERNAAEEGGLGVEAASWFATKTKEIKLMKEVEDRMAADLASVASKKFSGLESLLKLSTDISVLVHEAQKERALTAAYVGSGRTEFATELAKQRKLTDTMRHKFEQGVSRMARNDEDKKFVSALDQAVAQLEEIDAHRAKASSGSIADSEAIGFYTEHNSLMLKTISAGAEATDSGRVRTNIIAYVNFLQGKERAGIERAVMSKTFAADRFESGTLRKFGALVTAQDTYFDSFRELATPQQVAFYDQKLTGPVVDEVQRMRDIAFKMGSVDLDGFGVDANQWFDAITKKINLMKEVDDELAASVQQAATRRRSSAFMSFVTIGTVAAIAALGALAMVYVISRGILGPLGKSVNALEAVASGDYSQRLDIKNKDELGRLATAFNTATEATGKAMQEVKDAAEREKQAQAKRAAEEQRLREEEDQRKAEEAERERQRYEEEQQRKEEERQREAQSAEELQKRKDEERQLEAELAEEQRQRDAKLAAEEQKRKDEERQREAELVEEERRREAELADKERRRAEADRLAAEELRRKVDELLRVITAASEGDLTQSVDVHGEEAIDELAAGINRMLADLSGVVREVTDGALQFAEGSRVIAESSQSMAQGAQSQSATVEQMSASIEELARSIESVKEEANVANEVAVSTSKLAEDGGDAVRKANEAMDQIRGSSSQIGEIIAVISEIACQTNLLALNAAIEAARAGEHGQGFAVVADEVRKLAERSNEAAGEITVLIEESTTRVEEGATLSQETSQSLATIVESVQETAGRISSMAAATVEQATNASEVAKAIQDVSSVTEEAAASSEELASSSEQLGAQAMSLNDLVTRFKTGATDVGISQDAMVHDEHTSHGEEWTKEQEAKHLATATAS